MGPLIVIPGPDMLMVSRTVLRSGRRGFERVAGAVLVGLGVSLALERR